MPELITASHDAFTDLAISLALDPKSLGELRRNLCDSHVKGPFFNQNRYVRDLELALGAMWESRDSVNDPEPIHISSSWQD